MSLALTNTVAAVEFKPGEILRTADAYSGYPDTRRLVRDRHDLGRTFVGSMLSSNVMNDVGLFLNASLLFNLMID